MPRYEFRWSAYGTCEVDAADEDAAAELALDGCFHIDDIEWHQGSVDGADVHFERVVK